MDDDLTEEERLQIEIEAEELGLEEALEALDQPKAETPEIRLALELVWYAAGWAAAGGKIDKATVRKAAREIAQLEIEAWLRARANPPGEDPPRK